MLNLYNNLKNKKRILFKENSLYINVDFIDGPKVEIGGGNIYDTLTVNFIDLDSQQIIHRGSINSGQWIKSFRTYYTNWLIEVFNATGNKIFEHRFNLNQKKIYVAIDSNAVGDTIAWFPYIREFAQKHNAKIVVSTFHNYLFQETYPEFEFVAPGSPVYGIYAMYKIGWFGPKHDSNKNKEDCRTIPLQKIATNFLGLEHKELKPTIFIDNSYKTNEKYICIGPESTAKAKLWNNKHGWQEVVNYCVSKGYKVKYLGKDETNLKNVEIIHGNLTQIANILSKSIGFIGLGSGLSWLAWSLNIPQVLISGFSEVWAEVNIPGRIINEKVCHGCFNNTKYTFDKGDWNWCPAYKNFICTKSITSKEVIDKINSVIFNCGADVLHR